MFVSFYNVDGYVKLDFMVEMKTVPCINDYVIIDKTEYVVRRRTFSTKKPNRCRLDVERRYK